MKVRAWWFVGVLALVGFGMGACCKANDTKTAECKGESSSESCQTCCGGNYSYTGADSCTCY